MNTTTVRRQYSLGEEIANAVTHGLGVVAAIVGLCVLVGFAMQRGTTWHVASVSVYGATLVLLYASSTLYHSLSNTRACRVFKIIDHSAIYLLIAGTYTPFTLVTLRGPWGYSLFAVVWTLAIVGVSTEAFWVTRPKWLAAVVYLGMGWLIVVAIRPLLGALPSGGWWLLLAGGLCYTVGVAFYVLRKVPYMHAVWHLWVLAGSVCHFLAVLLYVVPTRG
jgi:hemolysin III